MTASQIKQGAIPPKPKKRPKQKRGLRRVSRKLASELRKYYRLKREFLQPDPQIQRCCQLCLKDAVDVHHVKGRGRYLNNISTWMPVCRYHHDWIHSHPTKARELGLLK